MKRFILVIFLFIHISVIAQNVSINESGALPDSSAMLDVSSASKGFLMPRMTQTQRLAIDNPANGLMVLQTNGSFGLYIYNNAAATWSQILDSAHIYSLIATLDMDSTRLSDIDGDTKIQVESTPDEDLIRFDVNGANITVFTDTGVGIGLSNPSNLLSINSSTKGAYLDITGTGDAYNFSGFQLNSNESVDKTWAFYHRKIATEINNFNFEYFDGTTYKKFLTIKPDGNVGLGLDNVSPSFSLDIRGSSTDVGAILSTSNSDRSHFMVMFPGRLNDPEPYIQVKSGDPLRFASDASGFTEFMRIDESGNVGINETNPTELLHINGGNLLLDRDGSSDVTRTLTIQGAGALGSNIYGKIVFKGYDSSSGSFEYEGAAITARNLGSSNHGALGFWTRDTDLTEWMRITRSGEVQIGPDANSANLNVNGNITAAGSVDIGSAEAFYMGDPNTNGSWRIIRSGNNLNFERREGGVWVAKTAILP